MVIIPPPAADTMENPMNTPAYRIKSWNNENIQVYNCGNESGLTDPISVFLINFIPIIIEQYTSLSFCSIHGFQSRDETAMLVYKTMAKFH